MTKFFNEIIGWYGTVAILLAYALVSFGVIDAHNLWYQIFNVTGAGGIAYLSFIKRAYQPAVLNVVWALIALVAIAKLF